MAEDFILTKSDWKDMIKALSELTSEVKVLSREMGDVKQILNSKVNMDADYLQMCNRVDDIWSWKTGLDAFDITKIVKQVYVSMAIGWFLLLITTPVLTSLILKFMRI